MTQWGESDANIFYTRERQMGPKGFAFFRDSQTFQRTVSVLGQEAKVIGSGDSCEKDARRVRVWEPAQSCDVERHRRTAGKSLKTINDFLESRFGPFADEFGGDVQVVDRRPADLCVRAKHVQQMRQRTAYSGWNGDSGKQSHVHSLTQHCRNPDLYEHEPLKHRMLQECFVCLQNATIINKLRW